VRKEGLLESKREIMHPREKAQERKGGVGGEKKILPKLRKDPLISRGERTTPRREKRGLGSKEENPFSQHGRRIASLSDHRKRIFLFNE